MSKRSTIAFAAVLLGLVGVIVWGIVREREPVYQGKRLSAWLEHYPILTSPAGADFYQRQAQEADEAVRQIGTNSIPTLLRKIKAIDSPLTIWFMGMASRQNVTRTRFTPAEEWNWYAAMGFRALGSDAKQAVPMLLEIYESHRSDKRQQVSSAAALALGGIGLAASNAVPVLLRGATNMNLVRLREHSVRPLREIHARPELVVPLLIGCLHDPDQSIRRYAVDGLGAYGAAASGALPALAEVLNDEDKWVRKAATNALLRISPAAAPEGGVGTNSPGL
jgi:uncharacterized protein YmfQ (DUF2313 family)